MNDEPEFHFEVTGAEIRAAIDRGDYPWLCEHVFGPALAQFIRKQNTDALINNPRPRARRQAGTRRPRTRRSHEFRP
jgi:hypothetical protein